MTEGRLIPRATWTLPAAGLLLGAPWITPYFAPSGPFVFPFGPDSDTVTWARIATSDGYLLFSATQALGLLSLVFGLFALYGYLAGGQSPRWAMAALILGVAGIVQTLMLLGVMAYAAPGLAHLYQMGVDACSASPFPGAAPRALCHWSWGAIPSMRLAQAFIALALVNGLTAGVAIWRSVLLPKWLAPVFAVAYVGSVAITPVLTLLGGFLMLVAGGWIAFHSARSDATAPLVS